MKLHDILKIEKCVHGARVKEYAERFGLREEDLIDFSSNVNPLPPPAEVRGLYVQAFQTLGRYPDDRYTELREAAADFLTASLKGRIHPDNIIPGNGVLEILRLALEVFLSRGDLVIVPAPTFGEYERQARLLGVKVLFQSLPTTFSLSKKELANVKVVFLCNPNNPTGELYSRARVERLAYACAQAGSFLIVDEAFMELSCPEASVADLVASSDNFLVLRSLTKCFALPGLRLGYGVGGKTLISVLDKARLPWNVNSVASSLGSYLLRQGRGFLAESRRFIQAERQWLAQRLMELGLEVRPSATNFLLADIRSTGLTAPELVFKAAGRGVLLRDASSFRGLDEWHIRVAVRTRKDNQKLLEVLRGFLGE